MSFLGYMVNRDENPAVVFEATFSDHYVQEEILSCRSEGFDVEYVEGDDRWVGEGYVRVVFLRHVDGRPWVFREFHPEGPQ